MRSSTFTTYINTREEPGAYAAFDKLAQVATARYGTITRAANEAARAAAGITGGRGSAGLGSGPVRDLKTLADAQRQVARTSSESSRALGSNSNAVRNQGKEAKLAAGHNQALARSLQTTATVLGVVQGPLGPLAGRVSAVSRALQELTGFRLGLAGLGTALFAVGQAGNNYTLLQSKLRPFFETQEQSNRAFRESIDIAQRSRAPLEAVVDLYGRLSAVGGEVGINASRVARITEVAAKAATLSGGTRQTQQAGIGQLLQGIGSNNLGGDELRSVKENTFVLAQAIAAGFKNADGSIGTTIGKLKELGSEGKLSAQVVADALERSADMIETRYQRLPLSLTRATTEFNNALTVLVGRFDEALQFTSGLASGLDLVANNLSVIVAIGAGIGARLALPSLIASFAAVAAAAKTVSQQVITGRQLTKEADQAWISGLNARLSGYEREAQALNRQKARIQENISTFTRLRTQAQADLDRASTTEIGGGSSLRFGAAYEERAQATRRLVEEQRKLVQVENLLNANGSNVVATNGRIAAATQNVAQRMGFLRTAATSLVGFLGGPWGVALTAATVALTLFATRVDRGKEAVDKLGGSLGQLDQFLDRTAAKAVNTAAKLTLVRTQERIQDATDSLVTARRSGADALRGQITRGVSQDALGGKLDVSVLPGNDRATQAARSEARRLADLLEKGRINAATAATRLAALQRRAPRAFNVNRATDLTKSGTGLDTVFAAERGFNDTVQNITGVRPGAPQGTKPQTRAQLAAAAAAVAAQTDLQRARAEEAKIRADGKQANESDQQYIQRLGTAIQQTRALAEAEKQQRGARTAGAVQARKEARDAQQDALDAAARQRDASLLNLVQTGGNPQSIEFLRQREAIIKTYQDEVNAIDASRAASNSFASEQIRNAEKLAAAAERNTEKRGDVLGQYTDQPRAVTVADDRIDDLEKIIGQYVRVKGELVEYTRAQFDADAKTITDGLRKPFNDYLKDRERDVEISRLVLQGREAEAEALRTAYGLYDQIGELRQEDYELLVRDVERQQQINDLLASRERITGVIRGTVDAARDSFEQFLVDLPTRGSGAFGDLFKNIQNQVFRITATKITESIFAGSDAKVRSLLSGRNSVDAAIVDFNATIGNAGQSVSRLDTSVTRAESASSRVATAFEAAAKRVDAIANGTGGGGDPSLALAGGAPTVPGTVQAFLARTGNDLSGPATEFAKSASTIAVAAESFASAADGQGDIVVQGRRDTKKEVKAAPLPQTSQIIRAVYGSIGSPLDAIVNKIRGLKPQADGTLQNSAGQIVTGSKFFTNIGKTFSDALSGAGKGAFASALAKVVGIPQDATGAAVGGALGGVLKGIKPIAKALGPAGALLEPVLGVLGGLFGSLFSRPKFGTASITSVNGSTTAVGNNAQARSGAETLAGSVQARIGEIAEALNGTLGDFAVSIGTFDGKYRVSTTGFNGSLDFKKAKNQGLVDFGKDGQDAAVQFAVLDAIKDGAVKGLRAGTLQILQAGKDLSRQLQRALSFEQVFKDLKARTDPVGAAVDEINLKFTKLKDIFAEAGATAEEYADLTKLYELERADAIKAATDQASSAIDQFLKDMVGSTNSPLNKKTVFENAASELNRFKSDINSGKTVDQNELLSAARNFQDASRALNGSSSSFFADFDALRSLLTRARDNAAPGSITDLPASPFASDPTVQAKLLELQQVQINATNTQTGVLSTQLDRLIDIMEQAPGRISISSLDLLPGFAR